MINSLINLFFPKVCSACKLLLNDNEKYICTTCRHNLPVTNYHKTNDDFVKKVFYGRAKLEQATALLRFEKKGIVQQLLHDLKYREQQQIGTFLGKWLGIELKETNNYNAIDMVIPVPLHKTKLGSRGYNQVEKFGKEIALALNTEYQDKILQKITNTSSQVNKKRFARWQNNTELFAVTNTQKLNNKHILLVDDIITTGATLEACIAELNKANNIKISIATMAIA
ncbi:ComF family protein [Lacinutrix sp. 5H-3-7-4]|uniref:ComF family protein n=1 Tax=Lacinutrix sp. (strain 5H-3-7-4) TaxID=983544 RepID=UPI00020A3B41|nr:ComF family protein [Lacinutrix sp. 5H-3-7-4]